MNLLPRAPLAAAGAELAIFFMRMKRLPMQAKHSADKSGTDPGGCPMASWERVTKETPRAFPVE